MVGYCESMYIRHTHGLSERITQRGAMDNVARCCKKCRFFDADDIALFIQTNIGYCKLAHRAMRAQERSGAAPRGKWGERSRARGDMAEIALEVLRARRKELPTQKQLSSSREFEAASTTRGEKKQLGAREMLVAISMHRWICLAAN